MAKTVKKLCISLLSLLFVLALAVSVAACTTDATDNVTLTFDANGGVFEDDETEVTVEGKAGDAYTPPTPAWDGHDFAGWALSADGDAVDLPEKLPEADAKYFAQWTLSAVEVKLTLVSGVDDGIHNEEVTVHSGDALADLLAAHPAEGVDGLTFEGWYNGTEKIADGATMPANDLTLTAKYNAPVTVTVYTMNVNGDHVAGEPETHAAIYGEALDAATLVTVPAHFFVNDDLGTRTTERLGKADSFTVYLDRESHTVLYLPNNEDIDADEIISSEYYGATITIKQNPFDAENYRFEGWSSSSDGQVMHTPGQEVVVEDDILLYAIWSKGYTDLFGGLDVIYFSAVDDQVAYLNRDGLEFEGVHDGDTFRFEPEGGEVLEGKVIGRSFAYHRAALAGTYTYYSGYLSDAEHPLIETDTLVLDGYLNATYTYLDEDGESVTENGVYYPGESNGEYVLELEDVAYTFILGEAEGTPAFSFFDIAAGNYPHGIILGVEGYFSLDEDLIISLDGVGGAILADYNTYEAYYGLYDIRMNFGEGMLEIHAEFDGHDDLDFLTIPLQSGQTVYVEQDDYAGSYNAADGSGALLELYGYTLFSDSAVLTVDGEETTGSYWVRESEVFGTIVDFYEDGGDTVTQSFLLGESQDGKPTFEPFDEDFTEYLWLMADEEGRPALYSVIIVLYDDAVTGDAIPEDARRAEIYAPVSGVVKHAATGYYTVEALSDELNLYTFVQTELAEGYTGNIFQSVTFLTSAVTTGSGFLDVYYVYTIDEGEGEELNYTLMTEETEGDAEGGEIWYSDVGITGMGGLYFAADGEVYEGSFTILDEDGDVAYFDFETYLGRDYAHFYFEVHITANDDETYTFTFIVIDDAPRTYTYSDPYDGEGDGETLFLNGNGSAVFTDGTGTEIPGTYAKTGDVTAFGDVIYLFTPAEDAVDATEFRFTLYYEVVEFLGYVFEDAYFYLYDENLNGTLNADDGSTLVLDGFYHQARYTDADENVYVGVYWLEDEGVIYFMDMEEGNEFLFTVGEEKTFALMDQGGVFADYYDIVDDSYLPVEGFEDFTIIFAADGNTVELHDADDAVVGNGTWVLLDDGNYEVTLQMNEAEAEIVWTVKLIANDYYGKYLCVLFNEDMEGVYVGADLTVLHMDGWGYGYYIDTLGFYHDIYTTVVSDGYLILTDYNDDFEFLISFDAAAKTFRRVDNSAYAMTFYSSDFMNSVVFADGLWVDGELLGYYIVDDERMATVFVQDYDTGAVTEEQVRLPEETAQTYLWDESDVTLYRWDGETIEINGHALFNSGKTSLDITLSFTPDGTAALNAPATITYTDEDGEPVSVGGLELVVEQDDYYDLVLILYDAHEIGYSITLNWDPNDAEASTVSINGKFLYTDLIEDLLGSASGIYFGHFAIGDLVVGGDTYWIVLDAVDSEGEELNVFVDDLSSIATEVENTYYGTLYEVGFKGTDGKDYAFDFFLITEDMDPWEGNGTAYLLIYSITLEELFEANDGYGNDLVLSVSTYVGEDAFGHTLGNMSVGLYIVLDGNLGYLTPADDPIFSEDGEWAIWTTPYDDNSTLDWYLDFTLDETSGAITGFTATQGASGYRVDTTSAYAVGFFYTFDEQEELQVIVVYGLGTYEAGVGVHVIDATFAKNDDGSWTATTEDAVYTITIALNDTQDGFVITVASDADQIEAGTYTDYNEEQASIIVATDEEGNTTFHFDFDYTDAVFDFTVPYSDLTRVKDVLFDYYGYLYMVSYENGGHTYAISFYLLQDEGTFLLDIITVYTEVEDEAENVVLGIYQYVYANNFFPYNNAGEDVESLGIIAFDYSYMGYPMDPIISFIADDNSYVIAVVPYSQSYAGEVYTLTFDENGYVTDATMETVLNVTYATATTDEGDIDIYFLYTYSSTTGLTVDYILEFDAYDPDADTDERLHATWEQNEDGTWNVTFTDSGTSYTLTVGIDGEGYPEATLTPVAAE